MKKLVLVGFRCAFVKTESHVCRLTGRRCSRPTTAADTCTDETLHRFVAEVLSGGEVAGLVDLATRLSEEDKGSCTRSDTLADHIHQLLDDTIAQNGNPPLEILWFWLPNHVLDKNLKFHYLLYGALRRSVEWHQASVTIVHSLQSDNCDLRDWSMAIQGSTIYLEQFASCTKIGLLKLQHCLVWHGPMYFISQKIGDEAALLSGCELHSQLANVSNDLCIPACGTRSWLEVANVIHEARVPLGMLKLSTHYSLTCLTSQHGDESRFVQLKKSMVADHFCLLVRLCHSEQMASTGPHSHQQWMQHIIDSDDSSLTSTRGCPSVDCVWAQGCLLIVLADSVVDEPVLRAYALQRATDLHTEMSLVTGLDCSRQPDSSMINDVASAVSELPCYGSVNELEACSLRKWNHAEQLESALGFGEGLQNMNIKLTLDPQSLPERVALESEERMLRSLNAMSSPDPLLDTLLTQNPADLSLNVEELLQHFSDNGNAKCSSLSPVRPMNSSVGMRSHRIYSSADAGELKALSYYDAARLSAHGVDYCVDDHASLSVDRRLARIQLRYVSSETNSTCATASTPAIQIGKRRSLTTCLTPPHTIHKHARTANDTTPRRSPRKHPRTLQGKGTTAKELARRLYIDRRKRPSSMGVVRKRQVSSVKAHSKSDSVSFKSKDVERHDGGSRPKQHISDKKRTMSVSKAVQMKRSERHKQRLQKVVHQTLKRYGLERRDPSFHRCVDRLFHVCHGYLKDLKTSRNLKEEMVNVAEQNAQQVVNFEKRQEKKCNS